MSNKGERLSLPFSGIASFARWPLSEGGGRLREADIAVLGLPYDQSTQWRTGCRFGPRSIRTSSTQYSPGPNGYYDPERDRVYLTGEWDFVDCGDVDMIHGDQKQCHDNIRADVRAIVKENADVVPVFLGGDHSVTAPVVEALDDRGPLHVVQLDAHLDFADERGGNRYGNGSPLRRAAECDHVSDILHLGMRGPGSSGQAEFAETKRMGNQVITMGELREMDTEALITDHIPGNGNVYVTIDCDVFDPSIAPGCASPSPGGMYYREMRDMLEMIARRGHVVGFDFVEVCPPYDVSGVTSQLAARICLDFIGYILDGR